MHDYSEMRKRLGQEVNQTLDAPILLFETWELIEVFVALAEILIFGIVFYQWGFLCLLLAGTLVGLPYLRKNFSKGMLFHYPYRRWGMTLPGLSNPGSQTAYSD